jgi:uncharacterized membrane protein (UPF0127 family)
LRTRADRVLSALLCAAALALACGGRGDADAPELPTAKIIVGNHQIEVEVADTPATRSRGLMFRESLPADGGMLFVFPSEQPLQFWMRNTQLPLSIAFADDSGRIVRIADLEPLSEALVPSGVPARYALEMNRGWFARHGVQPGDAMLSLPAAAGE